MRRNSRGMYEDTDNYKVVLFSSRRDIISSSNNFFVVYGIYSNKVSNPSEMAKTNDESSKIDVSRYNTNTTSVSSSIGKDINEVKDTTEENILSNNDTDNANIIVIDNEQSNNQNQSSVGSITEINDNQAITNYRTYSSNSRACTRTKVRNSIRFSTRTNGARRKRAII